LAIDVAACYRRYGPMVLRRCRRLLRDEGAAVDAMQDVFVQLLRHQAGLDDAAPSSLLFRMATNVCLNRLRGARRHPEDADDELLLRISAAGDEESRSEARSLLDRLFGREPESTLTLAVLHLHDGMTLEEVAQETGLSVSGVRIRLRTLRAKLQDLAEI
jgi:RNA polymerase sigma-70 factor (ECF subfamily)